ncbi:MAG: beta-lactamase family protein [Ignavibacteriae bacterium]|nr:beta-lactamase family protein [Ignavibacteriota bacterium]
MKSVLGAFAALLLFFSFSNTVGMGDDPHVITAFDSLLIDYDAYVGEYLERSNSPGAAVAIVKDGRIAYMRGFGVRNIDGPELVDTNTVFRIASLSKGFAGVLTALLVRDSILRWDDKVVEYLPTFSLKNKAETQKLTIRHLLTHTTGLVPNAFDNLVEANIPIEKLMSRLREAPTICRVGECYTYQNIAFSLIGPIIESATGTRYDDIVRNRLLQPLGMYTASVGFDGLTASDNYAHPHIRRRGRMSATSVKERYYNVSAAAGINASVYDMAQWLRAMMGGMPEVIPSDVAHIVTAPIVRTPEEVHRFNWNKRLQSAHYGFGWRVFDFAGRRLVFHSGGVQGYLSLIAYLPEERVGIVVLQNNSFGDYDFAYNFFERYLGLS